MSALTQSVNYTPKMSSVKSRHLTTTVVPSNGAQFSNGGDQIILEINTANYGEYLNQKETYLRFTVKNNNANHSITLDRDANCLFNRFTLQHLTVLEDISEYNLLNRMFQDCQISSDRQLKAGSVLRGHSEGTVGAGVTEFEGDVIAAGESRTYCISLLSGIIGPQADKYLPLGAMSGSPLRITLQLDTLNNIGLSGGGSDIDLTVKDVNLVCGILQVDATAQQMIEQASGGMYAMSSKSYRNYTASGGGNGENQLELLIPAKASSLTALYAMQRPQAQLNDRTKFSIGPRDRGDMTEYHYNIGGQRYPSGKNINCRPNGGASDAFEQLMRTFGGVSNINHDVDFGRTRWELTTSTSTDVAIASKGAFIAALECESFGQESDKVESGINTLNQNVYFNPTYDTITAAMHISVFSVFDILVTVEGGLMSAKF